VRGKSGGDHDPNDVGRRPGPINPPDTARVSVKPV